VFRLTPPEPYIPLAPWTETELHSFTGGSDGNSPAAGLIFDTHGALYGATQYGGTGPCVISHYIHGCGVVFKLYCPLSGGELSGGKLHLLPCYDHNPEATPSAAR
jgi:hypothetical protein